VAKWHLSFSLYTDIVKTRVHEYGYHLGEGRHADKNHIDELGAIFPIVSSEEARVGKQALPNIYNASSRLLNILILPIGASLAAISPTAIGIAYGPAYIEGAVSFALLTATAILPPASQ